MDQSERSSSSGARQKGRRGGLGRGLGSLIPTAPTVIPDATNPSADGNALLQVDINAIQPNPWQPRIHLHPGQLEELAESIRIHGLMQPLVVTEMDASGYYTLIAGERRWRASRLAQLDSVPVVVMSASPQKMLELAIIENVVRADLSPLEEAHAYRRLIEDFNLTQGEVAERVGKSRVAITNTLRLLGAPEQVQQAIVDGEITEGHARAILGLTAIADQLTLLNRVRDQSLTVRQTENAVRTWTKRGQVGPATSRPRDPEHLRVEGKLRDTLGTKVTVIHGSGESGRIVIDFSSNEHLQSIIARMITEDLW